MHYSTCSSSVFPYTSGARCTCSICVPKVLWTLERKSYHVKPVGFSSRFLMEILCASAAYA